MGSITKNRQSEQTLYKIAQRAFGDAAEGVVFEELEEGFCNVAYNLTLSDGREGILKIAPRRDVKLMACETELMQTEVEAMRLAREKGIPGVAEVYYYDSSQEICDGDYFIMEKLEENSFHVLRQDMTEKQQEEMDSKIGRWLHELNRIKGQKFGHFCVREQQFDLWFDAFYSMVSRIIEDGIRVDIKIGVEYQEILDRLKGHQAFFLEVTEPSFIHYDSWEGNIFVKDGEIIGFIDWERAMWAEGLMEDRFRLHSLKESFQKGYGMEKLTESQKIRSLWYDVYLYLIMMFEGTYRHYETDEQYQWVHGLFEQVWAQLKQPTIVTGYRNNAMLRNSFFELAKKVHGLDFTGWYEKGYWSDNYLPYSVFQDGKIVANVSVNRMEFETPAGVRKYIQLGTVMTEPAYRNRGYIRILMEEIEKEDKDEAEGYYLFANDTVLEFYPKFGYRAVQEYEYSKSVSVVQERTVRRLEMNTKEDRDFLEKVIEAGVPHSAFEMKHNPGLIMFYLSDFMKDNVYFIEAENAYAVAEEEGDVLTLYAVYSEKKIDLDRVAEAFGKEVKKLCLTFTPLDTEGFPCEVIEEADTTLFIKGPGFDDYESEKRMFPELSHA